MKLIKIIIMFCFLISGCKNNKIQEVNSLIGKIVLIDPGHGGNDNGSNYEDILEDEINLKVGLFLHQLLLEEGIISLMTRTGDYDLSSLNAINHKAQDLKKRVKLINDNKVDLFISLHLNIYLDTSVSGAQVFYQNNNERSKTFSIILQEEVNKLYLKQRQNKVGNYYILDNSQRTGVLLEMGFLSSPLDREKLKTESHQKEIAKAIFRSINIYFEV